MFKEYLKQIGEIYHRGDAREESFYSVLKDLLEEFCTSTGKKRFHITTLPKKTEGGNPDFRIWDGEQHITGYIEAKAPDVEDLDRIEKTEQVKRYLHTFPNLILTNFIEFRLYRDGNLVNKTFLTRQYALKLKTSWPLEKENELSRLLEQFLSFSIPKVYDAKNLAIELAKRTRFLKEEVIKNELQKPEETVRGSVHGFYKIFRDYLIKSLTEEQFSDLYAQTVTYGLFAARTRSEGIFNRKLAYDKIPPTIGILRDVFQFISLGTLPPEMEWIIDDISEILSITDINNIFRKFFHEGKGADPIVHFYETFLTEYDPKTRELRGVYYTPVPVVSYIVRSLHSVLKDKFGIADGFASSRITVLDPAAGTLTFPAEAAKLAVAEFVSKYGEGGKEKFIREHILKNFYAFELMMAPYAVGHIKMSFLLEELGYKLKEDDRVKLYLTNTLEMEDLAQTDLPGMASLSEESRLAGKVKKEQPILVILGNPPYSVSSSNKSRFIEEEMKTYKEDVRSERNIQPLSDDYIKFIRFAHWKIDRDGQGIIGMITNNSYLSGLIHRGMRKKLFGSFDEIYILNLHGSSRIGEKCPDGSKDENVFDIQQGDSILLFIKKEKRDKACRVFYQDVFGLRENKYALLEKSDLNMTDWNELKPIEPHYFFVEKDFSLQADYDRFTSITDIFDKSSSGVKTHRDHFVIGFTDDEIRQRMQTFTGNLPDDLVSQALNLKDTRDWKLKYAREAVKNIDLMQFVRPYCYRPFDIRKICYLSELVEFDKKDIMQNFFADNLGLCCTRRVRDPFWHHISITKFITNKDLLSLRDNCYLFPLYVYPKEENTDLFHAEKDTKQPNIKPAIFQSLSKTYQKDVTPEEIFYYIYTVLYSDDYRIKYAEFLKIDFPRVPFTKNYELFKKMAEYGNRLVDLHLLKSDELDSPIARFQVQGENIVNKPKYDEESGRIYINGAQYFEGAPKEVWNYQIGGYQVCDKWLKDRKGRTLTLDEIQTYCRIVTAIQRTIEIQKEIDEIYEEVERDIIEGL